MAADRPATNPKGRQLAFKPCRRFLGRRDLGSRLEQFHYQAIGALALALEICPVTGRPRFKLRDLRLQCLDLCLEFVWCLLHEHLVVGACALSQRD